MVEKLIRCAQCNQVIPIYGEFIDGGDNLPLPGIIWSDEDLVRRKEFFKNHNNHHLEELFVDLETYISDKPSYELIKISYFEATNGREKFLIKRSRERFDQPAAYEIIPGKVKISPVTCKLLKKELRKELTSLNGFADLEEELVEVLIKTLQEEVENIPPEYLFQEVDFGEEGETPLLIYGTFKEKQWERMIARLQDSLPSPKFLRLLDFLEKNELVNQITPLLIKQDFSIVVP